MGEKIDKHEGFEAIGNLAGSVASDFSNWLNIISSYALSITDNLIPNTRAHEDALSILEAAKQAEALTKQLVSISKASKQNGTSGTIELIDVAEAVNAAIDYAAESLEEKNIAIKFKKHERPLHIEADYSHFVDCLVLLFCNASEAMPDGGTINVDTSEKQLNGEPFVIIRVRDSGAGIPKNVISHIFDPFFTTKDKQSAMGLGLPVVKHFVEQWNGEIKVRSQPGQGASFRIFLPPSLERKKMTRKLTRSKDEIILVIDNNHDILARIKESLAKEGHKAHTLANSAEAIEYYKNNSSKISLIIIDVVMPGKNGKKVMGHILEENPAASIIMTSGFSRDYVKNYLGKGSWKFLQKPIGDTLLHSTVREALNDNQVDITAIGNTDS